MKDIIERGASELTIPLAVGGGIRTLDDFRMILASGADKVSVNSAAIINPQLIKEAADEFGVQCVVIAFDAKKREDQSGWNVNSLTNSIKHFNIITRFSSVSIHRSKQYFSST